MNERIQELIQAATRVIEPNDPDYRLEIFDKQLFAELIVRQCGYYADVFDAMECPVDMDPTETKPSDYIKREMGITE